MRAKRLVEMVGKGGEGECICTRERRQCRTRPDTTTGARIFRSEASPECPADLPVFSSLYPLRRCCGQECPMSLGFRHPGGMIENSPAFQPEKCTCGFKIL